MAVLPIKTQIGKYTIEIAPLIGMVTIQEPGLLVPQTIMIYNTSTDGSFEEIYRKAVDFVNKLAGIVSETQEIAASLIVHEEELTSLSNKVEDT